MIYLKIAEQTYKWNGSLTKRAATKYIILHHRGGNGDVQSIHMQHIKENKWVGIGYHFYVRKDGSVYRGRPINVWGAHCINYNDKSVAVCFEGNFENETMSAAQIKAGQELVSYLKGLYPSAEIKKHKDFDSTACPGKKFPFDAIVEGAKNMDIEDAIKTVQIKAGLEDETIDFLLCYKYGEELLIKLAEAMI